MDATPPRSSGVEKIAVRWGSIWGRRGIVQGRIMIVGDRLWVRDSGERCRKGQSCDLK